MKKRMGVGSLKKAIAILLCGMMVCLGGCGGVSQSEKRANPIRVATGPDSGLYYPIGLAFAEVLAERGYQAQAIVTPGTVENIDLIRSGEANVAIVMMDSLLQAYNSKADLCVMMPLYPNTVQVVATKESGIINFEDLKGKKVAVGAASSGVEKNAVTILKAYNMGYQDINEMYLDYGEAMKELEKGTIDAAFLTSGIPNSTIFNLAEKVPVHLVSIEGPGRDALLAANPHFSAGIIPENTYTNSEKVETVTIMNVMLVSKHLPDKVVYDLLEGIFADMATIQTAHEVARNYLYAEMPISPLAVPFHPGAEQFFRDKGMLQ